MLVSVRVLVTAGIWFCGGDEDVGQAHTKDGDKEDNGEIRLQS